MVINLNILLLVTFGYFWSCGRQDQKYSFGGGICKKYSITYDYYQPYQEIVLSLNILLLVTFGHVDHKTKNILLVEGYVEYI